MRTGRPARDGQDRPPPAAIAAVALGVAALILASCGGSTASGPSAGTWSPAVHPHPSGQAAGTSAVNGVSCPTPSFCAAVDGGGNAIVWNGLTWSKPRPASPDGTINSVSCSSPTFCVALSSQEAVTFDARTWSAAVAVGPAPTGPTGGQYQVSCVSTSFCASVNTAGVASLFDGTVWGRDAVVDVGTAARPVQTLSCATPTFCVVVSATGNIAMFNGTAWSTRPSPGQSPLHDVSCPTSTMAIDLTGHVLVFDGSAWSVAGSMPGAGPLSYSVSCPTTSFCKVARSDGTVSTWQSGAWGSDAVVFHDGSLANAAISCASPAFCAVVDSSGSIATYRS
jgi:hypothetical protein